MAKAFNRVLVTGATGFLGRNLAKRLIADGVETHLLGRTGFASKLDAPLKSSAKTWNYDGTLASIERAFEGAKPEIVFHLASLFLATHEKHQVDDLIQSNVLFPSQLAEVMVNTGVSRLVNTGTAWQHFESKEYNPVCLYAATKQAYEAVLAYYVEAKQLAVVTLKLFDTYGPGDTRRKIVPLLLERCQKDSPPLKMSPGAQEIDFVYVDDVIEAFLTAGRALLEHQVRGAVSYAVSSGKPQPLREVVATLEKVTGKSIGVEWGALPYRPREIMETWKSGEPLPGWKPKVSLEEGFRKIWSAKT